jgi:hypothetical protein
VRKPRHSADLGWHGLCDLFDGVAPLPAPTRIRMPVSSVTVNAASSATGSWWISAGASQESRQAQAAIVAEPQASKAAVSSMAQMLAKLDTLVKADPMKFADVTSQIASQLVAAAKATSGSDADSFSRLAEQFKAASQSGDLSSLQPPPASTRGYAASNAASNGEPSEVLRKVMDGIFATGNAI